MCKACDDAEKNPLTGSYWAGCLNCSTRALANSPMLFDALQGYPGDLQVEIRRLYPDDYTKGRNAVWDWYKRMKGAKHGLRQRETLVDKSTNLQENWLTNQAFCNK